MALHDFKAGDRVEVYSNSLGEWVSDAEILEAPQVDCKIDGFAVPAGAVKVASSAGSKWILPADVAANVRRPAATPTKVEQADPTSSADPSSSCSPRKSRMLGRTGSSKISERPDCKIGCGRKVQPGLTRGMKPFDTCCKRCAVTGGKGEHDANCQGARPTLSSIRAQGLATDPKGWLTSLLESDTKLEEHAGPIFKKLTSMWSSRAQFQQVKQAIELELCLPIEVKLAAPSDEALQAFDPNKRGSLDSVGFLQLCRFVLEGKRDLWFPPTLPAKAHSFVRQNPAPIESVYEFGAKLGEGSFGVVHSVTHRISGEKRVCKKIAKLRGKSGMKEEEILAEIESMALLDHPNVIKVYEYFNDQDSVSQIMEPCYGGELQDAIDDVFKKHKPGYGEDFICDVMKQMLRALAFMHGEKFMHKDLKPQNIMLADKDSSSIKVIDFGLAELFEADKKPASDQFGGTLLYMAPEVFELEITPKVDVWAAGVILYNLVTGDYPFMAPWPLPPGRDMEWWQVELQRNIQSNAYRPHPRLTNGAVTPECKNLLDMMFQKNAQKRPDAATCLEHPWFKQFEQETPTLSVGVTQGLEAYSQQPELKKAIFLLMAHQFSTPVLNELREVFTHFDVHNRGCLATESFHEVLQNTGMSPLQVQRVVHALDKDASGTVDWTEFIAAALSISICGNKRLVRAAFAILDSDNDDKVAGGDFEAVFAQGDVAEVWGRYLPKELQALGDQGPYSLEQFERYVGQKVRVTHGDRLTAVE
mmetsp:Transcript_134892/g.269154  ORF Transcript_134892/g.269154 Transcript_134892/m.269154 type:complete len:758 (-) Transcript_134892:108-2381(-)